MIQQELVSAFGVINDGRKAIGKPPFQWEDRLHAIAQELADFAWSRYISGQLSQRDAHHDFLGRAIRHGWRDDLAIHPPGGIGNRGEYGVSGQSNGDAPRDRDGWRHPIKPAEELAKDAIELLTKMLKKNEPHVVDFGTAWTHAALGYCKGILIIEYGYIPDSPNQDDIHFYENQEHQN